MLKCLKWDYTVHDFGNHAILDCHTSLADVNEPDMCDFLEILEHYCYERYGLNLPEPIRGIKINKEQK